ncbi:ABC transporter ATP-binding protein/permease [Streptomyces sp. NBC_01340]|jgi:ATP-binding cassette subfamily B protein|uniref:ABC transporter ATP-binding protein n=1 Tax=unclassified Streptomyces TaxID=2593676 RepID=UPI002256E228|nr:MULTISPECIES: ABC transporter ATP-binding protein [unclassified Streptomyces]MCX4406338.1 ABC transporter ATP-binding protein/permease [Streptomyces sp. NBC_01764]MCX4458832.1 ABC transporter ATP-binding protein/permease [Streptomyces sp. NBC_01719]MCX4498189.1 ABC transporter ATP-binding protein/permease [Streptomyces sp. NBC_01728]MCX5094625.1 ABC transporter ATP-binding protein/permease [Streptomyces sp. NBC_00365]MCX5189138.1 ABC transporter ATP-binding protein/permease [Streptomyces sp
MGTPESREGTPGKGSVLLALRYYGRELARLRRLTAPAMLLPALGNIGINYIAPLIVAKLVGRIAGDAGISIGSTLPYVLGFAGVLLLAEILWRLGLHCLNRLDALGIEQLYVIGMDELFAKDAAFFHDNFAGSLTKRVLSFASRFEEFVDTMTFQVMGSFVPLVFGAVVLWRYEPLLVVGLLAMIALTALCVLPLIRRRQALVDQREEAIARVSGHVADSLMNMDTVRAFAAEEREAAEHRSRVAVSRRLMLRSWDYGNLRIDTLVAPMSVLTNALGLLLAVALGGGSHGVEAVVVAFTYYSNATRIMFEFNQIYRRLESSMTEAAQFTELLLKPPTVLDPKVPESLLSRAADVRFEQVTFAHAGAQPLFEGLDLAVPSGAKIGLVGRSGGGKTTLARLLLRMTDIDSGRILIGGQDISRLRQADLRSQMAYVPQDPAMFHRTLRDNIAFARPEATEAEIRRAAEAAHVTEFADALPDGFDTMVGERGVKLSGGQRQRVALARAILRDAPILLLDEATSALDSESEILVQEALWRLMEGRTALVVAHRLSTVATMDRLVVLDRGRILEQGTHQELLAAEGAYAKLWQHQSGGFLDDSQEPADLR